MRGKGIIALLTDFGVDDPYVGVVKGVIYSINPQARIIDITHSIEKFNVKQGAFVLYHSVDYFPPGTVYLACVDPGVGTERKCIIVKSKGGLFVGPDNGILIPAAKKLGLESVYEVKLPSRPCSYTFHARDVFAPVAAKLSLGEDPKRLGVETGSYVNLSLPGFKRDGKKVVGEVVYIDSFGNVVTSIPGEEVFKSGVNYGNEVKVLISGREVDVKFLKSYGWAKRGELIALIDSFGMLELGVNMGSAQKLLGCKPGDRVEVLFNS